MSEINLILPKMGESVFEATIVKWHKNEGDRVERDETVLEIATDKVDSEIPSPSAGYLAKKLCKEGDVVKVGTVIAVISSELTTGESLLSGSDIPDQRSKEVLSGNGKEPVMEEPVITGNPVLQAIPRLSPSGKFYSPLVRNIAKQEGVSVVELKTITGTGSNGRVSKTDILNYLDEKKKKRDPDTLLSTLTETESSGVIPSPSPLFMPSPSDEIIEMDRMRKMIADHMVMSKRTSPHVTSFVEADVTGLVQWREKVKNDFEKKYSEKLTYTPLFVDAIIKSIRDFPMINSSVDGIRIIIRKNINIGMATALPSGNLIVPVIHNADHYNLRGLTAKVNDLARRSRENKLVPDEVQGGTFTLTNVGTFGNVMGTPIISQPQAAILATGVIRKKPAVIETPSGDTIGIRHMMFLSLSYDHRIIDGALGGSFVRRVADYLEKFDITMNI
ncbi:MAG: 2-oxo acid dehydrogenase subunit E2 [Bacteroidetes bacterium]|nr:2-oxo acid dehydrogenase subunit E2 [Bacteroidota bacterium]